jgi:hypothetical protein
MSHSSANRRYRIPLTCPLLYFLHGAGNHVTKAIFFAMTDILWCWMIESEIHIMMERILVLLLASCLNYSTGGSKGVRAVAHHD